MNKKIISLLMGVAMLATTVPAMATTEGIVQDDIMMISEEPIAEEGVFEEASFNYEGTVSAIDGQLITIATDGMDITFGLAEGVELGEIAVGDGVRVTSPSPLQTRDIKTATSVEKLDAVAEEVEGPSYFRHYGTVAAVAEGSIDVVIEDMVVTFATTDTTAIYTIAGDKAEAVKEGNMVIVASTSPLASRDIKEAAAIVITTEESETAVYVDTFNMEEEGLLSADGGLVLDMENAEDYAGKSLLVFYDIATMSLPARTNPTKVVVLEDVKAEETEKVTISFNVGSSIVNINGTEVEVEKPYIVGVGVTLVPIRVISESFGAEVNWDGDTKTVTVVNGNTTIVVTVGSKTATVNGEEKELEEAPELTENGFTMIPLRFISENLGAEVGYVHETQSITVEK